MILCLQWQELISDHSLWNWLWTSEWVKMLSVGGWQDGWGRFSFQISAIRLMCNEFGFPRQWNRKLKDTPQINITSCKNIHKSRQIHFSFTPMPRYRDIVLAQTPGSLPAASESISVAKCISRRPNWCTNPVAEHCSRACSLPKANTAQESSMGCLSNKGVEPDWQNVHEL